ncbi:hypothetical protein AB4Z34_12990 [Ensifer sp. 2YAB10]|uniref:hypothetical protein n=1 Tax=unclassified Ensifer TaxID=2633371 RepID=UPI003F92FE92
MTKAKNDATEVDSAKRFCGIIMPIASVPGYDSTHWGRVRAVIDKAIIDAGYVPRMVSESEDVGVIHSRIVQNLYDDVIVVCDVSARNANVMFELGMRLAFDKPTIIVKDEETGYSFDTQVIKHIGYRKDQRFDDVERFQAEVTAAILATIETKEKDSKYSPFLSHFGTFTPKTIDNKEVPQVEFIMKQLQDIGLQLDRLNSVERRTAVNLAPNEAKFSNAILSYTKNILRSDSFNERVSLASQIITDELTSNFASKANLTPDDTMALRIKVSDSLSRRGMPVSDDVLDKLIRVTWNAIGEFRGNSA